MNRILIILTISLCWVSEDFVYSQDFRLVFDGLSQAENLEQVEVVILRHFNNQPTRLGELFDHFSDQQLASLPEISIEMILKQASRQQLHRYGGQEIYDPDLQSLRNHWAESAARESLTRFTSRPNILGSYRGYLTGIFGGLSVFQLNAIAYYVVLPRIFGPENVVEWPHLISALTSYAAATVPFFTEHQETLHRDRRVSSDLIETYRYIKENQVPISPRLSRDLVLSVQLVMVGGFIRGTRRRPEIDFKNLFETLEEYSKVVEKAEYVSEEAFRIMVRGNSIALNILRLIDDKLKKLNLGQDLQDRIHLTQTRLTEATFQSHASEIREIFEAAGINPSAFGFSTATLTESVENAEPMGKVPSDKLKVIESKNSNVIARKSVGNTAFQIEIPTQILHGMGADPERSVRNGRLEVLLGQGVWLRFPDLGSDLYVFHPIKSGMDIDLSKTGPVEIWTSPWSSEAQLLERFENEIEAAGRLTTQKVADVYQSRLLEFGTRSKNTEKEDGLTSSRFGKLVGACRQVLRKIYPR